MGLIQLLQTWDEYKQLEAEIGAQLLPNCPKRAYLQELRERMERQFAKAVQHALYPNL